MPAVSDGVLSKVGLAARSLLWAALLPGLLAGLVPWYYFGVDPATFGPSRLRHLAGGVVLLAGLALLTACIVEFARRGRGTLSPLDPPRSLVVSGLYRYVRNPMYLGVLTIGIGQLIVWPSLGLLIWWLSWFAWVNVFVVAHEEPALRRQFGLSHADYMRSVGRWIPRLTPYEAARPHGDT
jgi:protein-S-isoprenylcysteine O-methyltransferase Ste14